MTTIRNPFIIKGLIPDAYFCDRVKETEIYYLAPETFLTTYSLN